jgi:hypothetical protein
MLLSFVKYWFNGFHFIRVDVHFSVSKCLQAIYKEGGIKMITAYIQCRIGLKVKDKIGSSVAHCGPSVAPLNYHS